MVQVSPAPAPAILVPPSGSPANNPSASPNNGSLDSSDDAANQAQRASVKGQRATVFSKREHKAGTMKTFHQNEHLGFKPKTLNTKAHWRLLLEDVLNEPFNSKVGFILGMLLTLTILASVFQLILATCPGFEDCAEQLKDVIATPELYSNFTTAMMSSGKDSIEITNSVGEIIAREECIFYWPYETTFNVLFTVELIVRLMVQYEHPSDVFKDPFFYIDTIAIVPFYVEVITQQDLLSDGIKAFRIFRLFKLARNFQGTITLAVATQESLSALQVPGFFLFVCSITLGVFEFYAEKYGAQIENIEPAFRNIPEAIWFILVTMTTVGYGDIYPASVMGKCCNIFAMLFGVLFLAMPLSIVGNNFCNAWVDRDRVTLVAMIRRGLEVNGKSKDEVVGAFDRLDTDGSGSINFKEFVVGVRQLGIVNIGVKRLHKLWKAIDTDHTGEIMTSELVELVFPGAFDEDEEKELDKLEVLEGAKTFGPTPVVAHNTKEFEMHTRQSTMARERTQAMYSQVMKRIDDQDVDITALNKKLSNLLALLERRKSVNITDADAQPGLVNLDKGDDAPPS